MLYPQPGSANSDIDVAARYDNYIGGKWVAPVAGRYFDVVTPIDGHVFCQVARSDEGDIELALDEIGRAHV